MNALYTTTASNTCDRSGKSFPAYRLFALVIAFAYGGVLASLPLYAFLDRQNYFVFAFDSWNILRSYWTTGLLTTLANEPLWLLLNAGLATLFTPDVTMRLLIFFPATTVAYLVLRHDPRQFIWLLLFLFLPQVIKNHVIHLRQGLAIAFFLTGWFTVHRRRRWFLMLMSPLIHASFIFVLAILASVNLAKRLRLAPDLRILVFISAGLGLGMGMAWLAELVGARQTVDYSFVATDISGLGFAVWCVLLLLMCVQGRDFVQRHSFEIGTVVFYLSTYFFVEVTARIFESSIFLVLLAGLRLTGWNRIAFLSIILAMGALQWAMRAGQPWLGFGFGRALS